jgi:hypothetical protein
MQSDPCHKVAIALPTLADEAVVEVLDFLHEFINLFESHYYTQIDRYYDQRSYQDLDPTEDYNPPLTLTDEPPF